MGSLEIERLLNLRFMKYDLRGLEEKESLLLKLVWVKEFFSSK